MWICWFNKYCIFFVLVPPGQLQRYLLVVSHCCNLFSLSNSRRQRLTCWCFVPVRARRPAAWGSSPADDDPGRSSCPAGGGVWPCGRPSAACAQCSELRRQTQKGLRSNMDEMSQGESSKWQKKKRQFKRGFVPPLTRTSCVRAGRVLLSLLCCKQHRKTRAHSVPQHRVVSCKTEREAVHLTQSSVLSSTIYHSSSPYPVVHPSLIP